MTSTQAAEILATLYTGQAFDLGCENAWNLLYELRDAVKKQVPRKLEPEKVYGKPYTVCPRCKNKYDMLLKHRYCPECGQKIEPEVEL